ncbi:MAG: toprim domain-containing protein, partial [Bacteroidota bacterium]
LQAKQLNLPNLLASLGYQPTEVKKGGKEYWYKSPFRNEEDASFHTSFLGGKWIWNDFGDIGGTVIDFVMRHENLPRVKDALHFLDEFSNPHQTRLFKQQGRVGAKKQISTQSLFSFQQQSCQAPDSEGELDFVKAQPIQNPLIFSYLERKRGIPRSLASKYFQQVHYRHTRTGKTFFAMGMKNQSDGYEIRIASDDYGFTKSSLGGKDITVIPGSTPGKGRVNIFEGMIDCLSLMAMYNVRKLKGDCIILNTAKHAAKASVYIRSQNYDGINTFLDNDRAGEECLAEFSDSFGDGFIHSQNHLYEGYRDVNESLVANLPDCSISKVC